MDQVARDVRSLSMRPGGETALAIGWDGTATELRVNKHEVDARPFQLRWSVRACDIGETETYVVVDGEGGGQLRVHPGATPEPGASLRCNLPSEAASLDRVRGGPRLVAVYKKDRAPSASHGRAGAPRGQARRAGGDAQRRRRARHVDDRRLRGRARGPLRFGGHRGGERRGPDHGEAHLALPGRGEPTVVMLTAKGGSTMWVGTSGGDILTAAVLKKS